MSGPSVVSGERGRLATRLDDVADLDPLLERVGDARFVLLDEASHGTHEFHAWRAARRIPGYLREHEPAHVETALAAFRCCEPYAEDPRAYARATRLVAHHDAASDGAAEGVPVKAVVWEHNTHVGDARSTDMADSVGRRYDAFCWFDETRALSPLPGTHPRGGDLETWPDGR